MKIAILKKTRYWLCRLLEYGLIIAMAVLVLDVLWGVFTRFVLGGQAKWTEELARFLLVWVALLGGALAFGENAHLGVDYFVGKLAPEARKLVKVFTQFIVLFFAIAVFIIGGTQVVSANMDQTTAALTPAVGITMGHVYLALPIAGAFMILFTAEQLAETFLEKDQQKEEN
ncbi:TRAP transporter small permease [Sedimentisphaera salicampi]|uniref:2,3-diketo-L-gulonate TRAP transporter small permease protein YiaM n=1 Tax=Sedimentisphaera salicampi TaxID=1941349 RepID=A0A1W6LJR7_9BACT|nr:TRAP transporter small permease [Sedimentisphaera salicampi]ARN56031.1 2,3-diketo-L-gulonate TRAP transporter small permease protein YiaM [Sedimentisphaera salicampi]OXU15765.1 2,3-diketo-L-gulonate TRAP transporter small permease protein YiaM [Sedimentisphaera salicampi]